MQPWLAAQALGDVADDPEVRAHLAACPKCQLDLRQYRGVAGLLPFGAAEVAPPADLRDRVIGAVAAAAGQPEPAPAHSPAPALTPARPARRWPSFSRASWPAMAFALLSVALLFWNFSLQRQVTAQANILAASGQGWQSVIVLLNDSSLRWYGISGDQANGRVWATPQSDEACLIAQRLPALPNGQVYQVWLARDGGQEVSGGTFEAREGNAWVIVKLGEPVLSYSSVLVTVEPAGGSDWPTGGPVLNGKLSSGTTAGAGDRLELMRLLHD
jgi:hypothetical protein